MLRKLAITLALVATMLTVQEAKADTRSRSSSSYNAIVDMLNSDVSVHRVRGRTRLLDAFLAFLAYNTAIASHGKETLICMEETKHYGPDQLLAVLTEYMANFDKAAKKYDAFHPHLLAALTEKFPCE